MEIVYIDSQNLIKALQRQQWEVDWEKLFVYLTQVRQMESVKVFMGHLPQHDSFYKQLRELGYSVVLKTLRATRTSKGKNKYGYIKGNIDVDLTISAMQDLYEGHLSKGYVLSNDGDFASLINVRKRAGKLGGVVAPHAAYASRLLTRSV